MIQQLLSRGGASAMATGVPEEGGLERVLIHHGVYEQYIISAPHDLFKCIGRCYVGATSYAMHGDTGMLAKRSFGVEIKDTGVDAHLSHFTCEDWRHSLYILPIRPDKRSPF